MKIEPDVETEDEFEHVYTLKKISRKDRKRATKLKYSARQ